jgi:hypothetical protein
MFFKLILVPKFSSIEFVHVVFIQDKDTFPRHIGLVVLISRSPQPSKIKHHSSPRCRLRDWAACAVILVYVWNASSITGEGGGGYENVLYLKGGE